MTEWVKNRQSVVFHAEVDNLTSKSRHHTTLVRQLCLFLDNGGLLRCGAEEVGHTPNCIMVQVINQSGAWIFSQVDLE